MSQVTLNIIPGLRRPKILTDAINSLFDEQMAITNQINKYHQDYYSGNKMKARQAERLFHRAREQYIANALWLQTLDEKLNRLVCNFNNIPEEFHSRIKTHQQ